MDLPLPSLTIPLYVGSGLVLIFVSCLSFFFGRHIRPDYVAIHAKDTITKEDLNDFKSILKKSVATPLEASKFKMLLQTILKFLSEEDFERYVHSVLAEMGQNSADVHEAKLAVIRLEKNMLKICAEGPNKSKKIMQKRAKKEQERYGIKRVQVKSTGEKGLVLFHGYQGSKIVYGIAPDGISDQIEAKECQFQDFDVLCEVCDKPASWQCTKCKAGWYCTKYCQMKGWKSHKITCSTLEFK